MGKVKSGGKRAGWKLVWREDRELFYVRFTCKGHRYQLATGQTDRREATQEAERIYANVVKSRRGPRARQRLIVLKSLEELLSEWIASLEGVLDAKTIETYEGYASTHWGRFATLDDATDEGQLGDYARARIGVVLRKTVNKEVSALFQFLRWCKEQGALLELPPRPELPAKAKGHRAGKQRARANELSPRQVEAFLAELPEWSHEHRGAPRLEEDPKMIARVRALVVGGASCREIARALNEAGERRPSGGVWHGSQVWLLAKERPPPPPRALGRDHYPIRAKFVLAYETGLRPATLSGITWSAWRANVLRIPDELDKNRMGRDVPLSARAVATLEALAKARGGRPKGEEIIFGEHDYRATFTAAARRAGIPLAIAPYDFRHARQTHLIDAGAPASGVMYLHGHTQLATASKYTHPSVAAAQVALDKMAHAQGSQAPESGPRMAPGAEEGGAKDGSRTRTGVTPLEPESGDDAQVAGKIAGASENHPLQYFAGNCTAHTFAGPWVLQSTSFPHEPTSAGLRASIPLLPPGPQPDRGRCGLYLLSETLAHGVACRCKGCVTRWRRSLLPIARSLLADLAVSAGVEVTP